MSGADTRYHLLDLFAGLHGWTTPFETDSAWTVTTVDQQSVFGGSDGGTLEVEQDIVTDVQHLSAAALPDDVDAVVASHPCDTFSVQSCSDHRDEDGRPQTGKARRHDRLLVRTQNLIHALDPEFYVIENPDGMLKPSKYIGSPAARISWCQYGHPTMKPTLLYGNLPPSFPVRCCQQGADCHTSAERGSRTGTQGSGSSSEKARIPTGLASAMKEALTRDLQEPASVSSGRRHPQSKLYRCPDCGTRAQAGGCCGDDLTLARITDWFVCQKGHRYHQTMIMDSGRCPYCELLSGDRTEWSFPIWHQPPPDQATPVGDVITDETALRTFAVPESLELHPPWVEERDGVANGKRTVERVRHYAAYDRDTDRTYPILRVILDEHHPEKGWHTDTGWWSETGISPPTLSNPTQNREQNLTQATLQEF